MDDDVSKAKPLLLNSIARFLENNGFSRTLKKFRSETHLEEDDGKNPTVDLEEMCLKFMGSTNDAVTSNATKQDGEKKLKHKKKKASNSTEVEVEEFIKEAENSTDDRKSALNHARGPVEHDNLSSRLIAEAENRSMKRRKLVILLKLRLKNPNKEGEKCKEKGESVLDESGRPVKEDNAAKKSKDKKKKASRSTDLEVQECKEEGKNSMDNGKSLLDDSGGLVKKDDDENSDKAVVSKENKATKKRKRHESKDFETKPINGDTVDESRPKYTDTSDDLQTEKKKLKASINAEKSGGLETITKKGRDAKTQEVHEHCNGVDKSAGKVGEKSASQKSMMNQNGSAEPTSVKAFQRVKVEEVVFSDERLKDNSYWAKGGAETGYGAKAQEVLGQVRGRDFRHEKTKKKRGSYRGGQIDLQSHSVKFNYSDDE